MFRAHLPDTKTWFKVLQTTGRSQTAVMNLQPGQASGDSKEAHAKSDQVLVVLEGEVLAEVGDDRARLRPGDVVVIPAGVRHRFSNEAKNPVRTVSVYAPPAYPSEKRE
jgi:mannose-6-phosphate isomerase-like protein (cupin superfamily)